MSLFARLQPVIASTLKVPPESITLTTSHEDMPANWDSLGQVNLIMAIEQSFDVYVDPEDFEHLRSVPTILGYLEKQGVS